MDDFVIGLMFASCCDRTCARHAYRTKRNFDCKKVGEVLKPEIFVRFMLFVDNKLLLMIGSLTI